MSEPARASRRSAPTAERIDVRKTYKLYVGGAFVRSESGRYDRHDERNVPRASRKDVREHYWRGRERRVN